MLRPFTTSLLKEKKNPQKLGKTLKKLDYPKKAEEIAGMENSTLQLTIAFISVFIFVIAKQGFHFRILPTDIAPHIILGLVNTGLGCFLYFSSIGSIKIQTVAILGYLEPLSAVFFSFIFLKETLSLAIRFVHS